MRRIGKHKLYRGDCLRVMRKIPDGSVDMVLCDLPYGTTACKWDIVIPLTELWEHYKRIVRPGGGIVLFGVLPFSAMLVASNVSGYAHSWVWDKKLSANGPLARFQPLKIHEDVIVFRNGSGLLYKPQGTIPCHKTNYRSNTEIGSSGKHKYIQTVTNFPKSIITFSAASRKEKVHPTQKPVDLCEYLIRTYTNKGMVVLDNTMGSGTTGVACVNTGRVFVGIEQDKKYFKVAVRRVRMARRHLKQLKGKKKC